MDTSKILSITIVVLLAIPLIWFFIELFKLATRSNRYFKDKGLYDTGAPQFLTQIWMLGHEIRFNGTTIIATLPSLQLLGHNCKLTEEGIIIGQKICGQSVCLIFTQPNTLSGVVDSQMVADAIQQSYDMMIRSNQKLWMDPFPLIFDIRVKNHGA